MAAVGTTAIAYDAIGNPTTYNGYELTWDGRQLKKMQKTNSVIEFRYNADGIRTSKTVNGVEHVYTLNGSQIVSETRGDILLIYLYDESGSPIGMQYRKSSYAADVFDTFYFEKNLQGDIIAIYTESGRKILEYTYDAWGNHSVTWTYLTMETLLAGTNPFRYRGYYYDTDTQLYYLQSRYYNPATGRFINADGLVSTGQGLLGYNMYVYCNNNPVMRYDPTGYYSWEEFKEDAENFVIGLIENFFDAVDKSIEAEISLGPGIDVELLNTGLGYSNDVFVLLDDGVFSTGHVTSIKVGPYGHTARHYSEIDGRYERCTDCRRKGGIRYYNGIDHLTCSHSQHSGSVSIGPFSIDHEKKLSVSLSASGHALYGGSISVGFNISEFFERLFDGE